MAIGHTLAAGAVTLACAGCMAGAAVLAARLAYAEIQFRRGTPTTGARAAGLNRFAPPAGYFERLADLDPEHAGRWLGAALESNPRLSPAWIAQGLAAERAGHMHQAESNLLEAARVDRQYLPAWTLANFYFRRKSPDQFWMWAGRAAALTYDDFRPLLALARAVEPDPRAALEKLGGGGRLLRADLDDLAAQGRFDDAQEIARLLLARRAPALAPGDAPRLLEMAERQIRAGNGGYALELWNAAVSLLNYEPLNHEPLHPKEGPVLANGDLLRPPTGIAFDWRLPKTEGSLPAWQPSRLTFSLSGDQPESCALLEQILPVTRAQRYRLHFEYFTEGLASPTGIVWDLDGDEGPVLQPAADWVAADAVLRASNRNPDAAGPGSTGKPGSTGNLGKLRLLYRREPGTIRMQGRLELRHLSMEGL
jgi:tetratricopeptide (TPR) repeat protein